MKTMKKFEFARTILKDEVLDDNVTVWDGDPYNSSFKTYYKDGKTIKAKGTFKHDKIQGQWCEYYSNGRLKKECFTLNGILNGPFRTWHRNGNLKNETCFNQGEQEGKATRYYSNGQIMFEEMYIDGILDGDAIWYYENGNIEKIKYKRGAVIDSTGSTKI